MEITTKRYQQLQSEERVTISSLKQQNYSIRAIARVLQRPASTISRELQRNGSVNHYGSLIFRKDTGNLTLIRQQYQKMTLFCSRTSER